MCYYDTLNSRGNGYPNRYPAKWMFIEALGKIRDEDDRLQEWHLSPRSPIPPIPISASATIQKPKATRPYPPLTHPAFHPVFEGHSVGALAYSSGTPRALTPFFPIAILNSLPWSPGNSRSASHASRMLLYCRSNSRSRAARNLCW